MVSRMFSITCWPEAYAGSHLYKDGVFQFIEVVNSWHAGKRDQAGPVIVIDKYVLYITVRQSLSIHFDICCLVI